MNTTLDDSDRLFAALKELPARPARLLELRFVDGKTDEQVAKFFGMSKAAYAVHLLRAARALTAAYMPVWGKAERDIPYEREVAEAESFISALTDAPVADPAVAGPVKTVRHLHGNAE
ncbi:MAG: sigma factor-like helix-turn-helix DNA-binding protein, partial [Myxococcaceae bacterium]